MARLILVVAAALLFNLEPFTTGQEPATPPQPPTDSEGSASGARGQSSQSEAGSSTKTIKPLPSFLIIGTVFNEHALSFPGVQVRIRQVGEKKFKWQTYTNSRGEFAVRVFPGYEYEVVVHVKKYEDQTQNVDARVDVQQRLSIKLEPQKAKTGAKP
jgi:Carboxypeptidase regulatory-like domain